MTSRIPRSRLVRKCEIERKAIRKKLRVSYRCKRLRSDQLRTNTSLASALSHSTNGLHVSQVRGQLYLSQTVRKLGNIYKNPTHLCMNGAVSFLTKFARWLHCFTITDSQLDRFEKSSMLTNPSTPQFKNRHGFAYEPRRTSQNCAKLKPVSILSIYGSYSATIL